MKKPNESSCVIRYFRVIFAFLAISLNFIFSESLQAASDLGGGKVFTLSENLDVDPSTGTASVTIPIEVPQGRAGIQPGINLLYNSSSGNGILGLGWTMELGSIQRSTKKGVPQYDKNDTFVITLAGSQQALVDISGAGTEFRPKIEGSFMKIKFNGTNWTVTDKKGTIYYFGSSSASRLSVPGKPTQIFRWHLDKIEDLNGNFLLVNYNSEGSQIYPSTIDYTGNTILGSLPYAQIRFNYENRASVGDASESYIAGFKTALTRRLKNIETFVGTTFVRRYQMNYATQSQIGRSLLQSVTLVGSDGSSTLPSTVMTYSDTAMPFTQINVDSAPKLGIGEQDSQTALIDMNNDGKVDILDGSKQNLWVVYFNVSTDDTVQYGAGVAVANSPNYVLHDEHIRMVDLNGDGLQDIVYGDMNSYGIWINNGVNGFNPRLTPTNAPRVDIAANNVIKFMDMNGDGKADLLVADNRGGTWDVYFNSSGSNFGAPVYLLNAPSLISPISYLEDKSIQFGDFNGDGLPDAIQALPNNKLGSLAGDLLSIRINNGVNGFKPVVNVSGTFLRNGLRDRNIQLADMNGDGLTDLIVYTLASQKYQIFLNNGQLGFNTPITVTNHPSQGIANGEVRFVDMNGDGQLDLLVGYQPSVGGWQVYLNNGVNGFEPPVVVKNLPVTSLLNGNIVFTDLNADGRLDVLYGPGVSVKIGVKPVWVAYFNNRANHTSHPSSLIHVENPAGGQLDIKYQNIPLKGISGFSYSLATTPFLLNVVKSISRRATYYFTEIYETKYDYAGGLWDEKSREFRGFKRVKIIDPEGNYSLTEYAQDEILRGKEVFHANYDNQNQLFNKLVNVWEQQTLYPNVVFPFLKQSDSYIYDGNATGRRTQMQYFYGETPQFGNMTKIVNLGEVDLATGADIGIDKIKTEMSYHNNTDKWLLGLTKTLSVRNNLNELTASTDFFFDYDTTGVVLPTKGYLTKKIDWAGPDVSSQRPFILYAYDAIGNLLSTADSKGSRTTLTYDPTYQLFLIGSRNAAGHQITNEYYGVNGVALSNSDGTSGPWGSLKSTTDANGQTTKRVYDTFGRIYKMVSPLDTITMPTLTYDYLYDPTKLLITSHQRIQSGQDGTMDTTQFYDGLGRLVQTKTNSDVPGQYIVSGQTGYNARGLPIKKYITHLTPIPLGSVGNVDKDQPFTAITYDAVGRILKIINPDGTYSNMNYNDWNLTTFDENGHKQKSYFDALGRLIKKEEYLGADGRHSAYPASAFTLYATTLYTYDSKGNLIKIQDAKGNVTTFLYDALNRKIQMTEPNMGTWKYGYDVEGNMIWQEDAKGQRINFVDDEIYRIKEKNSARSNPVNYTFDDANIINSKGRLSKVEYGGGSADFRYDPLGRQIQSIKNIGPDTYNVQQSYDAINRLVTLQYPDNSKVGYTYNKVGQINSVSAVTSGGSVPLPPPPRDPAAVPAPFTQYRFNDNAASKVVVDSGTSKSNAVASNNTSILSAEGKIANGFRLNGTSDYIDVGTAMNNVRFDSKGTLALWFKPEGGGINELFSFSSTGVFVDIVWLPDTQSIRFDLMHTTNLTISGWSTAIRCSTPANSIPLGSWSQLAFVQDGSNFKIYVNGVEQPLTYQYQNNKGAWLNVVPGSFRYSYLGMFVSGNLKGSIDDFRYYSNTALSLPQVKTLYNNGVGTEVLDPGTGTPPPPAPVSSYIKNIEYNPQGSVTKVEYGNGVITTYLYSPLSLRLTQLKTVNAQGAVLQDLNYSYDGVGNILSISDLINSASQTFKYDALNRLTQATGVSYGTKIYAYDEIGNIIQKDGLTFTYSKIGAGPHAVTSLSDGTTMAYDLNGNMIRKSRPGEVMEYSYDQENRLIQVRKNTTLIADYLYDGDGGRVQKVSYASVVKKTTPGVSFGPLTESYNIVTTPVTTKHIGELYEETENVGTKYIYAGNQRIAAVDTATGTPQFYHGDFLGSTNVVTDNNGARIELLEYDPYGKIQRHESKSNNDRLVGQQFTGKPLDDETGLVYFGARYYDPKLGRFISADTIVQNPSDPQTLNRYSYTANNPINRIDLDGHKFSLGNLIKGIGIAIVGAVLTIASGGALAPIIGAYWTGVVTGAIVGATIGGAFAAATGGDIGKGLLAGAAGGAVFSGFTLLGSIGGVSPGIAGNAFLSTYGGAVSGIVQAKITGADAFSAALYGGLIAGGLSLIRDTALLMRQKMVEQSQLDPRNSSGESVGFKGDGVKLGGGRYNPKNPYEVSPLGGRQGGQGMIGWKGFGFSYGKGSFWDRLVETFAGPHDFLNSWTYDSVTGNIRNLSGLASVGSFFGNIIDVGLAAPIALPSAWPNAWIPPQIVTYGKSRENI